MLTTQEVDAMLARNDEQILGAVEVISKQLKFRDASTVARADRELARLRLQNDKIILRQAFTCGGCGKHMKLSSVRFLRGAIPDVTLDTASLGCPFCLFVEPLYGHQMAKRITELVERAYSPIGELLPWRPRFKRTVP